MTTTDTSLIARGLERTPFPRFLMWLTPWAGLLLFGLIGASLCLLEGLNHTNMDNRFAFGLWIYLDLTIIAFGAGAFFTGLLYYILRRREFRAIINSAVVIGFICYSGAVAVLMVDVGQPLRAWFTFWHPNVHSMLTEVTFCISCYLAVLALEYTPIVLKNRKLSNIPSLLAFEHEIHRWVPLLAAVGVFLSFFHQGSLGGLYGVLRGRPFAFREGFGIWPSTFFLFIVSAAAVGPSFLVVVTKTVSAVTRKKLVRPEILQSLGKISGMLLLVYTLVKSIDTLIWINRTSPSLLFSPYEYYHQGAFGSWLLFTEIIFLGFLPAILLLSPRVRQRSGWLLASCLLACGGVALNRYVMTIQTLALPTLPVDELLLYTPSWQEVATFLAVVAYGVIVYSISYRYLNLFPQERELASAGR